MYGTFALLNLVCINESISNFPASLHRKDINTGAFMKCSYGNKRTHKAYGKATRAILAFFFRCRWNIFRKLIPVRFPYSQNC